MNSSAGAVDVCFVISPESIEVCVWQGEAFALLGEETRNTGICKCHSWCFRRLVLKLCKAGNVAIQLK